MGSNWTNTWNLSLPMNTWYGIRLNSFGCVECIDLDGTTACESYFFSNLGNNLEGQIPESIGNLSQVQFISFGNNFLSGSIPTSLGNLQNLTDLILRFNNLTGSIPAELAALPNLYFLNLTSNSLSGPIPDELGFSNQLSWIFLSGNDLSGEIPSTFSNLTQLFGFGAADNNLTGEVPSFLGELPILNRLHLQNNEFIGCFPEELRTLCGEDVIFTGNIALPWEGNFETFCNTSEQVGAPCSDGNDLTTNQIDENCLCSIISSTHGNLPISEFTIQPNPTPGWIYIHSDDPTLVVKCTILSPEGKFLAAFQSDKYDMSDLLPGVYFLLMEDLKSNYHFQKSILKY
jgi:hypothetical protein